jgi:acyl carrier protein
MVPAAVVRVEEFPITANGKVDLSRLPVPAFGATDEAAVPTNPTEELLCCLWADTLGVAQIGVDDDFFEHGGHSLVATQLVSRIRDALQVELPLRTLFEQPTVRGTAVLLRDDASAAARVDERAGVVLHVMQLSADDVADLVAGSDDEERPTSEAS